MTEPTTALARTSSMLVPANLMEAKQLASDFAASGLYSSFRETMTPQKALVKLLRGDALGIHPAEAMEQIHLIDGKTVLSAGLLSSLVHKSPSYRYDVVVSTAEECQIQFFERRDGAWAKLGPPVVYNEDDVRRGELDKKSKNGKASNHEKFPVDMKFARCLARGVRQRCNSVTGGSVYVDGEIPDPQERTSVVDLDRRKKAQAEAETLLVQIPDAWGPAQDARNDLSRNLEQSREGYLADEVLEQLVVVILKGMHRDGFSRDAEEPRKGESSAKEPAPTPVSTEPLTPPKACEKAKPASELQDAEGNVISLAVDFNDAPAGDQREPEPEPSTPEPEPSSTPSTGPGLFPLEVDGVGEIMVPQAPEGVNRSKWRNGMIWAFKGWSDLDGATQSGRLAVLMVTAAKVAEDVASGKLPAENANGWIMSWGQRNRGLAGGAS